MAMWKHYDAVRELLERDLHEDLCACSEWKYEPNACAPNNTCKYSNTAAAGFDVAETLLALDRILESED